MIQFAEWLRQNTRLSENSIYKYTHGASSISREMVKKELISKPLDTMTPIELDVAILLILNDEDFIQKNRRGDYMYSNALKQFRAYWKDQNCENDEEAAVKAIDQDPSIVSATERTEIIKARVGQGVFRQRVISKYDGRCIMSGIDLKRLLIASHIKPWAVASNDERLQADNGLCLSPAYDRLFDIGMITFNDNGKLLISSQLGRDNALRLGIQSGTIYDLKPTPDLLMHMEYHRDAIFIR